MYYMQQHVKISTINRLKTVRGHISHIIEAVEKEKYCIDVIQQSLAVQSSLRAIDSIILKGHLEEHVSHAMQNKGIDQQKSIEEIVEIFQKGRK